MNELNNPIIRWMVHLLTRLDKWLQPEVASELLLAKEEVETPLTGNPFDKLTDEEMRRLLSRSNDLLNIVDFHKACNAPYNTGAEMRINKQVKIVYEDDDMSYYEVSVHVKSMRVGVLRSSSFLEFHSFLGRWQLTNRANLLALPPSVAHLMFDVLRGLSDTQEAKLLAKQAEMQKQNHLLNSYHSETVR